MNRAKNVIWTLGKGMWIPLLISGAGCGTYRGDTYVPGPQFETGLPYYAPFDFNSPEWTLDYDIGPPRGDVRSSAHAWQHRFRAAPAGQSIPSIPSAPRRRVTSHAAAGRR